MRHNQLIEKALKRLNVSYGQIVEFCKAHDVTELSFYGSVIRDDFSDESDVDVLMTTSPSSDLGLIGFIEIQQGLCELLGREVDLVEKIGLEKSKNQIRGREILETSEVVYGEAA